MNAAVKSVMESVSDDFDLFLCRIDMGLACLPLPFTTDMEAGDE